MLCWPTPAEHLFFFCTSRAPAKLWPGFSLTRKSTTACTESRAATMTAIALSRDTMTPTLQFDFDAPRSRQGRCSKRRCLPEKHHNGHYVVDLFLPFRSRLEPSTLMIHAARRARTGPSARTHPVALNETSSRDSSVRCSEELKGVASGSSPRRISAAHLSLGFAVPPGSSPEL